MNIQIPIYFDEKTKQYFYSGDNLQCKKCENEIEKTFIVSISWSKLNSSIKCICLNCFKHIKVEGVVDEIRIINIVDEIPETAYRTFIRPPILTNAKAETVFSMAAKKDEGVEIIDNTEFANRPHPQAAEIEAKVKQREIDFNKENDGSEDISLYDNLAKDSIKSENEFNNILLDITNSEILTDDVDQIENKKTDEKMLEHDDN